MSEADDCIDFGENYIDQDDFSDNGSEGIDLKQADKRAHHNALERKRRDHIKDSFSSLRDAIPLLHGEKINSHKASRAQILKKAAEYIDHMRRKNNDHQKDIDVLKRENKVLEEKIRALEELKCAGQQKNSNKNQATSTMTCTRSKNLTVNETSNSTNNENGGTSILENRIKTESISSFEGNSDYESLNENSETIVQIVKKSNSNNQTNDTSNGTTLLLPNQAIVNNSVIKKKMNTQTKSNILLGPPSKRKRLNGMTIIAANTSIISK